MRNMIKTLTISALVFGAAAVAHAADAIDDVPMAPEAQDPMMTSSGWDGAYVGAKGTYQWGKTASGGHYNAQGLGSGLYGGYNIQQGKIVYGGEADLNYSGIDNSQNGVKSKQRLNGTIRGRVGYDLAPVLVYGAAGIAATDLKVSDSASSESKVLFGATVGAGVEAKITDTITARTEYRFTDYQTQTYGLASGNHDRSLKEHQVNVGLGVRF